MEAALGPEEGDPDTDEILDLEALPQELGHAMPLFHVETGVTFCRRRTEDDGECHKGNQCERCRHWEKAVVLGKLELGSGERKGRRWARIAEHVWGATVKEIDGVLWPGGRANDLLPMPDRKGKSGETLQWAAWGEEPWQGGERGPDLKVGDTVRSMWGGFDCQRYPVGAGWGTHNWWPYGRITRVHGKGLYTAILGDDGDWIGIASIVPRRRLRDETSGWESGPIWACARCEARAARAEANRHGKRPTAAKSRPARRPADVPGRSDEEVGEGPNRRASPGARSVSSGPEGRKGHAAGEASGLRRPGGGTEGAGPAEQEPPEAPRWHSSGGHTSKQEAKGAAEEEGEDGVGASEASAQEASRAGRWEAGESAGNLAGQGDVETGLNADRAGPAEEGDVGSLESPEAGPGPSAEEDGDGQRPGGSWSAVAPPREAGAVGGQRRGNARSRSGREGRGRVPNFIGDRWNTWGALTPEDIRVMEAACEESGPWRADALRGPEGQYQYQSNAGGQVAPVGELPVHPVRDALAVCPGEAGEPPAAPSPCRWVRCRGRDAGGDAEGPSGVYVLSRQEPAHADGGWTGTGDGAEDRWLPGDTMCGPEGAVPRTTLVPIWGPGQRAAAWGAPDVVGCGVLHLEADVNRGQGAYRCVFRAITLGAQEHEAILRDAGHWPPEAPRLGGRTRGGGHGAGEPEGEPEGVRSGGSGGGANMEGRGTPAPELGLEELCERAGGVPWRALLGARPAGRRHDLGDPDTARVPGAGPVQGYLGVPASVAPLVAGQGYRAVRRRHIPLLMGISREDAVHALRRRFAGRVFEVLEVRGVPGRDLDREKGRIRRGDLPPVFIRRPPARVHRVHPGDTGVGRGGEVFAGDQPGGRENRDARAGAQRHAAGADQAGELGSSAGQEGPGTPGGAPGGGGQGATGPRPSPPARLAASQDQAHFPLAVRPNWNPPEPALPPVPEERYYWKRKDDEVWGELYHLTRKSPWIIQGQPNREIDGGDVDTQWLGEDLFLGERDVATSLRRFGLVGEAANGDWREMRWLGTVSLEFDLVNMYVLDPRGALLDEERRVALYRCTTYVQVRDAATAKAMTRAALGGEGVRPAAAPPPAGEEARPAAAPPPAGDAPARQEEGAPAPGGDLGRARELVQDALAAAASPGGASPTGSVAAAQAEVRSLLGTLTGGSPGAGPAGSPAGQQGAPGFWAEGMAALASERKEREQQDAEGREAGKGAPRGGGACRR